MSKLTLLAPILWETAKDAAKDIFKEIIKDQATEGYEQIRDWFRESRIEDQFASQLESLPSSSGILFGFLTYQGPDGKDQVYGPYLLGKGSKPADPLVQLGFSNGGLADMGKKTLEGLSRPAGSSWKGMEFYWAAKSPNGNIELSRVTNPGALMTEAIGEQLRGRLAAHLSADSGVIQQLANQEKIYNELEDRMRNELRERDLEARLAAARQLMNDAKVRFTAALDRRDRALQEMKNAQNLQDFISLLGLVGDVTSLIGNSRASADYQETAAKAAASNYNQSVKIYISIVQQTTILPQQIPNKPEIEVPLRPP